MNDGGGNEGSEGDEDKKGKSGTTVRCGAFFLLPFNELYGSYGPSLYPAISTMQERKY